MKLVKEFTLSASLGQPINIGNSPAGQRSYFDVLGGTINGERVNGKLLGGGEWALIGSDKHLRVDVRLQAQTDDGANLYIQYFGIIELNEKLVSATENGTETDFGDQYFYTNPRIETGDPRYAWLNQTFLIGEGRIVSGHGVEYRVWRPA